MLRSAFVAASSLSLLSTALAAQSVPHTTTMPTFATGTFYGGASSFPFGRTGGRAQYWFRNDQIPAPSVINAIGSRPSRGLTTAARSQSVEVQMANSTLAHGGFTRDFATNLGATATVVYARQTLAIPALNAVSDPDQPGVWIPLDAPFVLTGPNLIVDFDLGTAVGAASAPYNSDLMTLASPGRNLSSDPSCGGTLTATSSATSHTWTLTGAPATVPTALFISGNSTSWAGGALPYLLDGLGMTGCLLSVDPQVTVNGATDGAGSYTLNVPLTLPAPAQVFYAQAAHASPINALGVATTNATRTVLGNVGFCSYIYNFTVDGALAQNGPNNWQPALLVR